MKPTFMSLFSGVGGFDLGLERAGWQCVAQCDNDPFCNKVLAKHWPEVKRYDDVQAIRLLDAEMGSLRGHDSAGRRSQLPGHVGVGSIGEPAFRSLANRSGTPVDDGRRQTGSGLPSRVDLICGGFPCQDLSVAGKRAGLDGARSGLWFEFHRILSELRPALCLIENVPGLLSSNQGRDFAVILDGLEQLGFAVGWAVLDSQHFGVPQRRRRVYIVGGPSRECVQQILSLCEGGDWHSQARRAEREDVAGTVAVRTAQAGSNGWGVNEEGLAYTLDGADGQAVMAYGGNRTSGPIDVATAVNAHGGTGRSDFESETFLIAPTLGAGDGDKWGSNQWVDEGKAVIGPGVRRLTPVECERLQGFPDDWTSLDDKTPDGPRYKACGNAVSVPVIEYLGVRMKAVLTTANRACAVPDEGETT